MKGRNMLLRVLVSMMLALIVILPASAAGAWADGHNGDARSIGHIAADRPEVVWPVALSSTQGQVTPMIAAGDEHTVGLKSDGTVVAAGLEVELAKWNLIEAVP